MIVSPCICLRLGARGVRGSSFQERRSTVDPIFPIFPLQIHLEVGHRVVGYWCVRNFDNKPAWIATEAYLLLAVLLLPTAVMSFSYGRIIYEVCHVVRQREMMTKARCGGEKRPLVSPRSANAG